MNIGDLRQTNDTFAQNLTENAYINMCTTTDMEIAIAAIEKQIPKELTIKTTDEKIRYTCPCGKTLIVEYKNSLIFGTKTKYCPECGQALDWGKEQWKNA